MLSDTKYHIPKELQEVIRRLVDLYQPEKIYLFGSRAREDSGPDSDYDLLLIISDQTPPDLRRSQLAYKALRGTGIAVDVLIWTHTAFSSRLHIRASLPSIVIEEGKLLYVA